MKPHLHDELPPTLRSMRTCADQVERAWPRWMTLRTSASYFDLSEATVRRLIASGRLRAHRPIRGRILIDRLDLDTVIASATTAVRIGRGRSAGTRNANQARAVRAGS
jgi:excisionase family DNA binding protein